MSNLTELDKSLQELAIQNWAQFVAVVGKDAIISAKICIMRQNDKSYGEIAVKLGITHRQAEYGCNKCDNKE